MDYVENSWNLNNSLVILYLLELVLRGLVHDKSKLSEDTEPTQAKNNNIKLIKKQLRWDSVQFFTTEIEEKGTNSS